MTMRCKPHLNKFALRLTRVQHGQIDAIAATCRQMSDQEAAEVADFIFSLFLRIAEKHH